MRPLLLDLFCGAGGCARGYQLAGFDVVGVDLTDQPRYVGQFIKADALAFLAEHGWEYDAIHASPPCQDHMRARGNGKVHGTGWLLAAARNALIASGKPWVIENVPGAPLRPDYRLCGCQFGLKRLKRERWFETSWKAVHVKPACHHPEPTISVTGSGTPTGTWKVYGSLKTKDFQNVMGIDWMRRKELSQAIPPAYTQFIGAELLRVVELERAA
jgi:DNA (cytosine-5)-methyltransferase 1